MIGVELVYIQDSTTPREFAKELRWNNAYHRLAMGFDPSLVGGLLRQTTS